MSGFETATAWAIRHAPTVLVWLAVAIAVFGLLETTVNLQRMTNLGGWSVGSFVISAISAIVRSLTMPAVLLGLAALVVTLREKESG